LFCCSWSCCRICPTAFWRSDSKECSSREPHACTRSQCSILYAIGLDSSETATTFLPPAGYVLYRNEPYHFSFSYPPTLQVHSYSESGGAFTVALQDPTTNQGFEVYVTPYGGTQISEAKFKLDEPSGVIQERTDVMIDGARATMFYGNNAIMGDTREVWFIKGGLLYEVTTYKQLDAWLAQIMQTWQFVS
jgi:hypothetical protein